MKPNCQNPNSGWFMNFRNRLDIPLLYVAEGLAVRMHRNYRPEADIKAWQMKKK